MLVPKSACAFGVALLVGCAATAAHAAERLNVGLALFPGATNAPLFLALR